MKQTFYVKPGGWLWALIAFVATGLPAKLHAQTHTAQDGDYTYEYVDNDPLNARIYTLKNGLKVYLSVNRDEPRIQTAIAVRAGSKNDPRSATGLAHYLEHMLFKGSDHYGTTDWETEKVLLQQISDLYEQHREEGDPGRRAGLYRQIDSLSYEASKLAIPNEYDKMVSSMGAKGTNAYTSTDQTVYVNDIPANELDKWLGLEEERFSKLVLRLFHTELETVYEEFNMGQDNDNRKVYSAMNKAMFKKHPYNISTIGLGEHLKSPSMVEIHNYFDTYYVPNNMAVVLSGDLDPSKAIRLVDKHFGHFKPGKLPDFSYEPEDPITEPMSVEVTGSQPEFVTIAYRMDGAGSRDALLLNLVSATLQNGQAGLIDLNLIQKQKILEGSAYFWDMNDYSLLLLSGKPREGQSLDDVKKLLLEQVDILRKGDYEDWLLPAVIKDFKLSQMQALERNRSRTNAMLSSFIEGTSWEKAVNAIPELEKVTKAELTGFVREKCGDNYLTIYKRSGDDESVMKVEKPPITQVELNREAQSGFYAHFEQMEADRLQPLFLDYEESIETHTLKKSGIPLSYIKNKSNPLFKLYYIFDMGDNHNKKLSMAVRYLPYLGTDKYSAAQLQEVFYKLGLSFDVSVSDERMYVTLSGLEDSFGQGVELFEHILANVQPDEGALTNMVGDIIKKRADNKLDKSSIFWGGGMNYAMYGPKSHFTDRLPEAELKALTSGELVELIKGLTSYKHQVFYYGQNSPKTVCKTLKKYHKVPKNLLGYPKTGEYPELATDRDQVLFINYDMVQANIMMLSKDQLFDKGLLPYSQVFGDYFGGGMSSIVFQEIREARALAYSAFASYYPPEKVDQSNYDFAFMAVQADKMQQAITAMRGLLNDMPKAQKQFDAAKTAVLKKIESERITKSGIFFNYLRNKKLGLNHDVRKDVYSQVQNMSLDDLNRFFNQHVKGKKYTFVVMGKKEDLDMEYLKSLGNVKEVTLEELFGY